MDDMIYLFAAVVFLAAVPASISYMGAEKIMDTRRFGNRDGGPDHSFLYRIFGTPQPAQTDQS